MTHRPELVVGKRVLDVGSGTGLVSMLVAHIQRDADSGSIVATDFNEIVLARLAENIERSASALVKCC